MKIIDLESVMISPLAYRNWMKVADEAAQKVVRAGGKPEDVPIEQGQVNDDGTLTIFVEVAGHRIEAVIPQGHWQWNN